MLCGAGYTFDFGWCLTFDPERELLGRQAGDDGGFVAVTWWSSDVTCLAVFKRVQTGLARDERAVCAECG